MEKQPRKMIPALTSDVVIAFLQLALHGLFAIPVRWLCRIDTTHTTPLTELHKGALLASNHQSRSDPFLIVAAMRFRELKKIVPIRFPTTNEILCSRAYNPRFFPILTLLGCFAIGESTSERMKAIYYIRSLLKQRKTIMLFPEGAINREANVLHFKKGIDFFMSDTDTVLFVRLDGFVREKGLSKNWRRQVTFGEVLSPPPNMSTAEMRDYLTNL